MDDAPLAVEDILGIEGDLDIRLAPDSDWESVYCHLDNCELSVFANAEMTECLKVIPITPDATIETDGTPNALFFDILISGEFALGVCATDPAASQRWLQILRALIIPRPRRSLTDFRIISVLGRNPVTKVVLAEDLETHEQIAIKSVRKRHLVDSKQSRAVIAERNILMLLSNPFIVQLKCAFQTPTKFYLGLEYAAGGTLARYLERAGPIPSLDARLYVAEIAIALVHLHSLGVIYRDLNQSHVLFDATGHVKLSDFALAKTFTDPDNLVTTSICGVHQYHAPEIIGGTGYSFAVDWWALGILFCEMVACVNPFTGASDQEFVANLVHAAPRIPPGVDAKSRAVMEGLLTKDPAERFGSEALSTSALFAGFDWELISEKRYKPRWQQPGSEPVSDSPPVALESLETPGRDSMTIEGFSYVAPFDESKQDREQVDLDISLVEEYENLARDLK
jgi:serine/threonine protein kinase